MIARALDSISKDLEMFYQPDSSSIESEELTLLGDQNFICWKNIVLLKKLAQAASFLMFIFVFLLKLIRWNDYSIFPS